MPKKHDCFGAGVGISYILTDLSIAAEASDSHPDLIGPLLKETVGVSREVIAITTGETKAKAKHIARKLNDLIQKGAITKNQLEELREEGEKLKAAAAESCKTTAFLHPRGI